MFYVCPLCRLTFRPNGFGKSMCEQCYELAYKEIFPKCQRLKIGLKYLERMAPVCSLYHYRHSIRSLVLNAKVSNEWRSVDACKQLMLNHPGLRDYLTGVEAVMPAPSSLWGRWRGRTDLAYILAQSISESFGVPMVLAPLKYYWRYQKRARIPGEIRRDHGTLGSLKKDYASNLTDSLGPYLIVDDVITTGHTLATLQAGLGYNYRFLAFASAFKDGQGQHDACDSEQDTANHP